MSLIQDALKRQQEETEKAGGGGGGQEPGPGSSGSAVSSPGEAPSAEPAVEESGGSGEPATPADGGQENSGEQQGGARRGVWPAVAGIVLLVILAVGAGIYLVTLSVSRLSQEKEPAAAGGETTPDSAQVASADSPAETAARETHAAAASAQTEITEAEPARPEPALPAPEAGAEAKAKPVSPPASDAEKAGVETRAVVAPPPPPAVAASGPSASGCTADHSLRKRRRPRTSRWGRALGVVISPRSSFTIVAAAPVATPKSRCRVL